MSVLSLRGVCRDVDGTRVLENLDWEVPEASVYGLLGKNGAGKTTALRVALGLLAPDTGVVQAIRSGDLAFVPQQNRLLPGFTGQELLDWLAPMYAHYDLILGGQLAERFELPLDQVATTLSVGQQRSLHAVLAIAANTPLLVLDEPAAGLDPVARRTLNEALISRLSADRPPTIVLSTHLLADVAALADHVGILAGGRLVCAGPVDVLLEERCRLQLAFPNAVPADFQVNDASDVSVEGRIWRGIVPKSPDETRRLTWPEHVRADVFPLSLDALFQHEVA